MNICLHCYAAQKITTRNSKFMDKQFIADAFRKARKDAGLKRKVVAETLDRSDKVISAWENCNGQPDIATMYKLAKIYGLKGLDDLFCHSADGFELRPEEKDLVLMYRDLTTNSKQIVMTLTKMELNHVHSVKQGETPIRILPKTKKDMEAAVEFALAKKSPTQREQFLKVFNQSAAAGFGDFVDDDSFEEVAIPSIPRGTEFGIKISGNSMQPKINDGDVVFVKRQASIEPNEIGIFIYNGNAYCKQLMYESNSYYLNSFNAEYPKMPVIGDSIYCVGKVLGSFSG